MKKGLIIYDSKTGTTHKFGEEIKKYLKDKGAEVELVSVSDYKNDEVGKADFVLLGGWTSGLFIFLQHPDKPWIKMANDISPLNGKKVGLFTTYKVATGSVFKKMKKNLGSKVDAVQFELKSKHGELKEEYKVQLDALLN